MRVRFWKSEKILGSLWENLMFLRETQHTPGAYPKHPQTPKWKEFLHKLLVGGLGYAPGVCWKVLRMLFTLQHYLKLFSRNDLSEVEVDWSDVFSKPKSWGDFWLLTFFLLGILVNFAMWITISVHIVLFQSNVGREFQIEPHQMSLQNPTN